MNPIEPEHYNKGEIDLYESWYLTRPFAEFRAIMEAVAERYMKRDKSNRLEDIDKCIYTLQRLREYEEKEADSQCVNNTMVYDETKENELRCPYCHEDLAKVYEGRYTCQVEGCFGYLSKFLVLK